MRGETKYGRMEVFGRHCRRCAARWRATYARRRSSGARPGHRRDVLDRTLIRVGNDHYARATRSFGLTTLQDRHVRVRGPRVVFKFRAKSGVQQVVEFTDAVLARSVRHCQDLPGQQSF